MHRHGSSFTSEFIRATRAASRRASAWLSHTCRERHECGMEKGIKMSHLKQKCSDVLCVKPELNQSHTLSSISVILRFIKAARSKLKTAVRLKHLKHPTTCRRWAGGCFLSHNEPIYRNCYIYTTCLCLAQKNLNSKYHCYISYRKCAKQETDPIVSKTASTRQGNVADVRGPRGWGRLIQNQALCMDGPVSSRPSRSTGGILWLLHLLLLPVMMEHSHHVHCTHRK